VNFIKPFECEKEGRVIESVRTGSGDSELREHAATCPACSEAALAAGVLKEMRAADLAEARIPDAGLMWWKAQLLAKREAAERATQPINFVERFACAWVGLCGIGVCVWQWRAIRSWLASLGGVPTKLGLGSVGNFISHFSQNLAPSWLAKSTYLQGFGLVMVSSIGVLLALVAFAAYFTRSEE
jgi:predicted anti-sigma-YlaC factor YlaD